MKRTILAFVMAFLAAVPAIAQDTGWIGTSIADQPDRGVLIRSVEANSPAERAGLKANDIILQYNKEEVVGARQLSRLVGETPVGRSVDVTVRRDNRDQTFKVTAEKAPFSIGPLHIEGPDLSNLHLNTNRSVALVNTSVSMSQDGIRADSLTPQLREFFGARSGEGVLVASVDANSQAGKSDLKAGDVIIAVDGRSISSPQDLNRELRSRTSAFTLKVVRNKLERDIRIEK
jgi:serine protease Do